jgi:hypothetical protein
MAIEQSALTLFGMNVYNMILNSTCHDENKLPQAEFLSRAAVTAKKLSGWWRRKRSRGSRRWGSWSFASAMISQRLVHAGPLVRSFACIQTEPLIVVGRRAQVVTCTPKNGASPPPKRSPSTTPTKKPPSPSVPYVTRVMCDGYEWRVICGMDQLKRYRIHRIEGEFEYCVSVQRHEFTVIDP